MITSIITKDRLRVQMVSNYNQDTADLFPQRMRDRSRTPRRKPTQGVMGRCELRQLDNWAGSWASRQAKPRPSGQLRIHGPGQREAPSEQPHTWLANAGRSDAFLLVDGTAVYIQPRIACRPASVIRMRSILNIAPFALSVSVTTVARPASASIASISREKP